VGGDTGNERVKATDSLPKLPDAELDADGTMPVAAAIIVRWSELADELCGLEVRPDKCHVTSLNGATGLCKDDYGDMLCDGTLHMGIPIGSKQWEMDKVAEIADRVPFVYKQAQRAATKQCTQLLSVYCGGTPCLTHILRSVEREKTNGACITADEATTTSLSNQMGVERLSDSQIAQTALPLRYGGFGYTRAADVADAAIIGTSRRLDLIA